MAEWTHRFCERCWFDGPSGSPAYDGGALGQMDGGYRLPSQVLDPETRMGEPGACCGCGGMTITGIWVRVNQAKLMCQGRHEDTTTWARV